MLECGVVEEKSVETVSRPSRPATDPIGPTTKKKGNPDLHSQDFSTLDSGVLRTFCVCRRFLVDHPIPMKQLPSQSCNRLATYAI